MIQVVKLYYQPMIIVHLFSLENKTIAINKNFCFNLSQFQKKIRIFITKLRCRGWRICFARKLI
jgi:hypothetical protein